MVWCGAIQAVIISWCKFFLHQTSPPLLLQQWWHSFLIPTLHCGWGRTDTCFKASRVVVGYKLLPHTSNRWICVNAKPKPDKDMSLHKLNFNLLEMRSSSTAQIEDLIIYSWLSRLAALSGWWTEVHLGRVRALIWEKSRAAPWEWRCVLELCTATLRKAEWLYCLHILSNLMTTAGV